MGNQNLDGAAYHEIDNELYIASIKKGYARFNFDTFVELERAIYTDRRLLDLQYDPIYKRIVSPIYSKRQFVELNFSSPNKI